MRFQVGDKVVYPNHGVGVIEDIRERNIAGIRQHFYHLRILATRTTVMVPVGNSRTVGLRRLFDRDKIGEFFAYLRNGEIESYSNWKGRYKENAEKMRSGHLYEMADVLKNLVYLSRRKSLSYREKQMYERARYLIVSEVAMVEGSTEEEVQRRIDQALEVAITACRRKADPCQG